MADADCDQLYRPALFHHGDHIAQMLFQKARRIDRKRRIIHRRPVRDHHQDPPRLGPGHHPPMRPFQRLAIDVFLEQPLFHHQAKVRPDPPPRRIRRFIDDVAQIIQPPGMLRAALRQPFLTSLAALPRPCVKAKDLDLDRTPFQRARQNIGANRSNGNRPPPHRARIVDEQSHHCVAELGILFPFERQSRRRIGDNQRQPPGIQHALFQIKQPAAVLLRLKTALQLGRQPPHGPL